MGGKWGLERLLKRQIALTSFYAQLRLKCPVIGACYSQIAILRRLLDLVNLEFGRNVKHCTCAGLIPVFPPKISKSW